MRNELWNQANQNICHAKTQKHQQSKAIDLLLIGGDLSWFCNNRAKRNDQSKVIFRYILYGGYRAQYKNHGYERCHV